MAMAITSPSFIESQIAKWGAPQRHGNVTESRLAVMGVFGARLYIETTCRKLCSSVFLRRLQNQSFVRAHLVT
ncbi:MAG: hypothetical protein AAGF56_03335 [Pseudomonadota bacterium]